MTENVSIILRNARPDNQVHLLLWDTPDKNELIKISLYNNALIVNYRENLLQRINPGVRFLALHHDFDGEIEAIKSMCCGVSQEIVLLENLDCLVTYLQVQPRSKISLFWKNLEKTRKLERLLWILLPSQLVPNTWPQERIKHMSSG